MDPNLIGYGESPCDRQRSLTTDDEVDALWHQLADLAEPVHLVGHSFGGAVATHFALRYPERVASLVVYEPVLFKLLLEDGDNTPELREIRKVAATISNDPDTTLGRWRGAREFVNYWAGHDAWSSMSDRQHSRLAGLTPKVGAEFGALMNDELSQASLAALQVPLRLLCGTATRRPARRIAEVYADSVPGAELELVDGLGHMAPVTNPDIINSRIVDHIEQSRTIACESEPRWRSGGEQVLRVPDDGESGRFRHRL